MKHLLVSRPTPTFSGRATNAGLQKKGAMTRDKSRKNNGKTAICDIFRRCSRSTEQKT